MQISITGKSGRVFNNSPRDDSTFNSRPGGNDSKKNDVHQHYSIKSVVISHQISLLGRLR